VVVVGKNKDIKIGDTGAKKIKIYPFSSFEKNI